MWTQLYRELTAALEAVRPSVRDPRRSTTAAPTTRSRGSRELQASDPRLRVIRFRRNFGQTAAFAAGFAHARGRYIVTMDGDLQNDPRDIPAMVDHARAAPGRHRRGLAQGSEGRVLQPPAAVDDRQLASSRGRPA